MEDLTIVIPCKNEALSLRNLLPDLKELGCRIVVVDDGSTDDSAEIAKEYGVQVIRHRKSFGNGAAVRSGIASVETEYVGVMDGDGQHSAGNMVSLYAEIVEKKADLVVGARNKLGQASFFKHVANMFYNKFATFMVGETVDDLTSGQRVFRTSKVKPILWMFPNKFSYPTTSTMVFFRLGYDVLFKPIDVAKSLSKSNIRVFRDGFRFFLIIMKVGTLFSPFKLFLPISILMFGLGALRYLYTYFAFGTFTNMSALLFVTSVLVFLMGVLSEQVATAVMSRVDKV